MRRLVFALLFVPLALTACDSKPARDGTVRRLGQPDYIRSPADDLEMDKAIQTAHESVNTFITALRTPNARRTSFSVKKPFNDGENVEHIWLSDASFDGTKFHGVVDNEPVDVKNVKFGETADVAKGEISDWFYVENGKLIGGYTLRVLYARMPAAEKREFQSHLPFKME